MTPDTDPCQGCEWLYTSPDNRIPPYCARASSPRQVGCLRYPPPAPGRTALAAEHSGEVPPETMRRQQGQRGGRNGSRRRG